MMNGPKKSDLAEVAVKPMNKAALEAVAESVERRAGAEGNTSQQSTHRTQCRERVSQALERVRLAARKRKEERFTALLHPINVDLLRLSFYALKRRAAPGVDGVTWQDYEVDLESNLASLHERVQRATYRALPSRRKNIPKPDGQLRALGIAALEDKIVQRAAVAVLGAIYEEDFLGFSYGFRPKRSQHDALDALCVGIDRKKVRWILDVDIRGFFDQLSRDWLIRFLKHRIADTRMIRLVRKWLQAGVLDEGVWTDSEMGVPQGATASPLLANVLSPLHVRPVGASVAQASRPRGYGRCAFCRRYGPWISTQRRRRVVPDGYA
jgi:retron-type reverse transcriptase